MCRKWLAMAPSRKNVPRGSFWAFFTTFASEIPDKRFQKNSLLFMQSTYKHILIYFSRPLLSREFNDIVIIKIQIHLDAISGQKLQKNRKYFKHISIFLFFTRNDVSYEKTIYCILCRIIFCTTLSLYMFALNIIVFT